MKPTITVLGFRPDRAEGCVVEITNQLAAFQLFVGGPIECVPFGSPGLLVVCNEEGKLLDLPPNRALEHDIIAGCFLLVASDQDGDFISLTAEQIEAWRSWPLAMRAS